MRRVRLYLLCLIFIIIPLTSCTFKKENSKNDYWPTNKWRTTTPEKQGMDSGLLAEGVKFLKNQNVKAHSLTVIRNGYVIADAYYYPYKKDTLHNLASISKSTNSILMGIAIDKGIVNSTEQELGDFFPDSNKSRIKISDLLTMRSGFVFSDNHSRIRAEYEMNMTKDWLKYIMAIPMGKDKPGETFFYNNFSPCLVAAIVNKTSHLSSKDLFEKYLCSPLGIDEYLIGKNTATSSLYGISYMRPLDLAKIGLLFLNDGKWDQKQIISKNWTHESTKQHVSISNANRPETTGYGYYWWQDSFGSYSARGRNGQRLHVFPDKNMIVVITGGNINYEVDFYNTVNSLFKSYILPAIKSDKALPENNSKSKMLEENIANASNDNTNEPVGKLFSTRLKKEYLNTNYKLTGNSVLGFKEVSISNIGENDLLLKITMNNFTTEGDFVLPVHLDVTGKNVYSNGRKGIPLIARVTDMSESNIKVYLDEIGNIDTWEININFIGEDHLYFSFKDLAKIGRDINTFGIAEK